MYTESSVSKLIDRVIFYDPGLTGLAPLLQGLQPGSIAIALDPTRDAIGQISQSLAQYHDLSAIDLLTHGSPGTVQLGSTRLEADRLTGDVAQAVAGWGQSLAPDGDVLIYGCNVAATPQDSRLLTQLAGLIGADVAASDDLTGAAGDWDLEVQTGPIEAGLPFDLHATTEFPTTLATIAVDTTTDKVDGTITSLASLLADKGADGKISLREAISAANNTAGADEILLPAGTYAIAAGTTNEDNNTDGDLDISQELKITGAGSAITQIQGNGVDRVLHITTNPAPVTLEGVTISGGTVTAGGAGIASLSALTLNNSTVSGNSTDNGGGGIISNTIVVLNNSTVTGNSARGGSGGGIYSWGVVTLNNSTISNNSVGGAGLLFSGGGIFSRGVVTLNNSMVSGNSSHNSGGGISGNDFVILNNSTISGNSALASGLGGGVYTVRGVTLTNSTVTRNLADRSGGGISSQGPVTLTNSTIAFNSANTKGGGLYRVNAGTTTIQNSIIANNINSIGPDLGGNFTGTNTFSDNIIGSLTGSGLVAAGLGATNQVGADPLLQPLASNGGPSQTHALAAGSPAIDKAGSGATATDQRGWAAISRRDIGAYEFGAVDPNTPSPSPEPDPAPIAQASDPTTGREILDGRTEPVQLAGLLGTPIERSFSLTNRGGSPLTLKDWQVPAGFQWVEPLPTTIAPGSSATFVLRLASNLAGFFNGNVGVRTNDPQRSFYNFPIEGQVSLPACPLSPLTPDLTELVEPIGLVQRGDAGNNRLLGGPNADVLRGELGNDTIAGFEGDDLLLGGTLATLGTETLGAESPTNETDRDLIFGNQGRDRLFGNRGDDTLLGGRDNDTIFAGQGNDILAGNQGDDLLSGDRGQDTLRGGLGIDTLVGGCDPDVFALQPGFGPDEILDFTPGEDRLILPDERSYEDIETRRDQDGNRLAIVLKSTGEILAYVRNILSLRREDFLGR